MWGLVLLRYSAVLAVRTLNYVVVVLDTIRCISWQARALSSALAYYYVFSYYDNL